MLKEKNEVALFVRYCDLQGIMCVHVPNEFPLGGLRNKYAYINMLKSQGYRKGFPDLIVFVKNESHRMLFLEFKRIKGGIISEEQKKWIEWLSGNGYCAKVVKGCEEAIKVLEDFQQNKI